MNEYALYLTLTVLFEVPVVLLMACREAVGFGSLLLGSVAVNLLSHPIATLAWISQAGSFATVEAGVICVEAFFYVVAVGLRPGRAVRIVAQQVEAH